MLNIIMTREMIIEKIKSITNYDPYKILFDLNELEYRMNIRVLEIKDSFYRVVFPGDSGLDIDLIQWFEGWADDYWDESKEKHDQLKKIKSVLV